MCIYDGRLGHPPLPPHGMVWMVLGIPRPPLWSCGLWCVPGRSNEREPHREPREKERERQKEAEREPKDKIEQERRNQQTQIKKQ